VALDLPDYEQDGVYVVLAKHLNAPLLTGDRKLAGAPKLPV
jgi:predicted nucleic acid-binding protein